MVAQRRGRVFRLQIEPPSPPPMFPDSRESILQALQPGTKVERYRRTWRVGAVQYRENILVGKLGYEGAEGLAEIWDEEASDFTEVAVPAGLTAPFAINLESLEMVVQPRGQTKLNGILGAVEQMLLQLHNVPWKIRAPRKEVTFEKWRSSVAKVTSVRFRVLKPNPHYRGTPDIEALLEESEADVVRIELQADTDEGIDTNSPFVDQSQRHVESGYGEARYVGQKVTPTGARESVYNSKLNSEEETEETNADQYGEVPFDSLTDVLRSGEG